MIVRARHQHDPRGKSSAQSADDTSARALGILSFLLSQRNILPSSSYYWARRLSLLLWTCVLRNEQHLFLLPSPFTIASSQALTVILLADSHAAAPSPAGRSPLSYDITISGYNSKFIVVTTFSDHTMKFLTLKVHHACLCLKFAGQTIANQVDYAPECSIIQHSEPQRVSTLALSGYFWHGFRFVGSFSKWCGERF